MSLISVKFAPTEIELDCGCIAVMHSPSLQRRIGDQITVSIEADLTVPCGDHEAVYKRQPRTTVLEPMWED